MKIQVFGSRGMLGSAVISAIARRGHSWVVVNGDLETVNASQIHAPAVINCAGLVKQHYCPMWRFMDVNATGAHRLADACNLRDARLIHVSTDCVFQGPGPHREWDAVDCEDEYARSKFAGEVYGAPHVTIRTSFVGFGKRGLLAEMRRIQTMRASDRLLWSGHTVDTVADVLVTLAERDTVIGLLHVPGEFQSRWELCNRLIQRYDLSVLCIRDDEYEADRRLISTSWDAWLLPELPGFAAQLELMEPRP